MTASMTTTIVGGTTTTTAPAMYGARIDAALAIAREQLGQVAFGTADTMVLGESYDAILRVSPKRSPSELAALVEAQLPPGDPVTVEWGLLYERMRATLTGDDFQTRLVVPAALAEQEVSFQRDTQWQWAVEPQRAGPDRELYVTLDAILPIDGQERPFTIQTYQKRVLVTVTLGRRVLIFAKDSPVIAGTLFTTLLSLAGLGIRSAWKRRKEPQEKTRQIGFQSSTDDSSTNRKSE